MQSIRQVVVMDGVRVMKGGTHTELVKCRGMYAEIFTAQSTAYVAMYK